MRFLPILLALAPAVAAAQAGMRGTDITLGKEELTELISGNMLEFHTNGLATYRADGSYDWRYAPDGERVPGIYQITDDSSVCVDFANGFSRCDYIVRAGERYVMIIENGERYPVRMIMPIE